MKYFCGLLLFTIFSICYSTSQLEEFLGFDLKMRTPEMQIQQRISKLIQSKIEIHTEILCQLVKRGYLKAASELYDNYFVMNQISIGEQIKEDIANLKSKVTSFNDKLLTSDLQVQIIEPAFKWAQSREFVFLHVKFAHRLDAPGCITVKIEKMEFQNNSIEMIAFGIQAHQPIKFHLNLTLFNSIVPENCSWNLDSVGIIELELHIKGTMFINITKADETSGVIWKRLCEDVTYQPQIWWEMRGQYKKDMEDFIKVLEEEEEKIERLQEKERKDKRQKEKEAKEANKESKFYDF